MIPFSPPFISEEIIAEVVASLRSGWITTGPRTAEFEKQIGEYCEVKNVLALNSATAGLELMLRWFGVGNGDEVILPAYTYAATGNVILHCGATPVFADVNESDFNIDPEKILPIITAKTKAVISVDMGGVPVAYHAIRKLVEDDSIKKLFNPQNENQKSLGRILFISDAAHSFGAHYQNKRVGSQADVTAFSFHAVKNLTTAEGGAVCLNFPQPFDNEKIRTELAVKSLHGQNKDALAKTKKGNWEYDIVEAGYKWNMPDVLAAIGLAGLKIYDSKILNRRREIMEQYHDVFSTDDRFQPMLFQDANRTSSFHLYLLRVKNISEETRNRIIQKIFDKDVSVNVHFKPLPMLSVYKSLGFDVKNFPVAFENYSREISLPVYPSLTDEQVKTIIAAAKDSVSEILQ